MIENLYFVPESFRPAGFFYPKSYCEFVSSNGDNGAILNLPPWVFSSNELWAMHESQDVFGQKLIPFAQAETLDMIAYFEASDKPDQVVWVANPWDTSTPSHIYGKFKNFEEWLLYASEISKSFLSERPDYADNKLWFPG